MRYIVFPSVESKDGICPNLYDVIGDLDIDVISGPTDSGLYLIECGTSCVDILKFLAFPHYIMMEDFDPPTIH